jgi:hypothetical protein
MSVMNPAEAALFEAVHELPLHFAWGPQTSQTLVERLLDAVRRHVQAETDALGHYQRIAEDSGDPVIALVMRLVLQDEERHHGLLQRIADSLHDALEWSHSPGALPLGERVPASRAAGLANVAHELIDEERQGAKALRQLANQERGIADGLHSLLLEMMALDSEKHAHLLQYVERRLRSAARA